MIISNLTSDDGSLVTDGLLGAAGPPVSDEHLDVPVGEQGGLR